MKQITITIALFALVIVYPVYGCDVPNGNAVASPQVVPDCSYLDAAIGLNEQSAIGAFSWSTGGFGLSGGAVTAAPVTLNGGFTRVQTTVDQVVAGPILATDGTDFLLVEYSNGATAARIVHGDGTFGSRTPIVDVTNANVTGATQNGPGGSAAVVWDGNEYLVLTTEFVRPGADVSAVPKVVSATVRRDGTLASAGVIADNAVLLTAVKAGSSAVAIWRTNGAVQAGFAVPQQIVTNPIVLPSFDGIAAAAANNGSSIAVVFADSAGVDLLLADTSFNNRTTKTVNAIQSPGLEIVPDGSDFLVLQSDASLNARATRISGGNPGAFFTLATGAVVGAASNSRGTIVLATHGCGTIASQFISHGATTASAAADLTMKGSPQTSERLIPTTNGHQLTYIENHNLYTQFVDNSANAQGRLQLTTYVTSFATTALNGGTAVAWIDGTSGQALRVARFDASGAQRGSTLDIPVSVTVNAVSVAASGDSLLVAYQGTPFTSHHPEVHAALIDTSGALTQHVLLSGAGDEGSNVTTGVNGSNWMIAWHNGPPHVLVVITTPVSALTSPTRRDISMATIGIPILAAADGGNVYWIERASQSLVHKTVVSSGADSVIGQPADNIDTVRVVGGTPVWTVRGGTTGETTSVVNSPLGTVGCFTSFDSSVEYDTHNNALAMWVYSDGTQLHVQLPSAAPANARRRAVKH
ncbi:MAG TPA: hypothetical protein VGJ81_01860 [Thermoanaerobaculia bacterium]